MGIKVLLALLLLAGQSKASGFWAVTYDAQVTCNPGDTSTDGSTHLTCMSSPTVPPAMALPRDSIKADGKNTMFLSSATANGASTMTLIFSSAVIHVHCELFVAGYGGNAIASIQIGVGDGPVDSGTNYAASFSSGGFLNNTSVSVTGVRVDPVPQTTARYSEFNVYCGSTTVKRMSGVTNSVSVSAATAPTLATFAGIFVNTAGVCKRMAITAFTALTGTSTQTMNNGTNITCWGRNDD